MFKSLFSKYITAFTAIIAVSFLILVLAMSSMVSNYSIDTKKTLMDSSARYTSEIIDTYRVFDNTGFSGTVEKYASRIRDALEEYASTADSVIFVMEPTERCWSSARTHTMRSWAASCSRRRSSAT